jgi:hypothetical protein
MLVKSEKNFKILAVNLLESSKKAKQKVFDYEEASKLSYYMKFSGLIYNRKRKGYF